MTDYNISANLAEVEVLHQGKAVLIRRTNDDSARLAAEYARIARPCPPYCVQPLTLAKGVETLGELELLDLLRRSREGDGSVLVIDSRTPDWVEKGTIPGAINIPFAQDMAGRPTDLAAVHASLTGQFGVRGVQPHYDFAAARTLAIFCNGPWCGQTPNYIRTLLSLGYPAEKLKWYRGGMQDWCSLGLTVI